MAEDVKQSTRQPLPAFLNSRRRVLLAVGVCIGIGALALVWKLTTPDDSDDPLNLNSDIENRAASRGPALSNLQKDKNAANATAAKSDSSARKNRSRLIDMAIARGIQMEPLKDGSINNGSMTSSENPFSLATTDANLQASSTNLAALKKSRSDLSLQLQEKTKEYGADHPYTIETAMNLALVMERLNEDSDSTAETASAHWLSFVEKLTELEAKKSTNQKNKTVKSNAHTNDNEIAAFINQIGLRKICRWTHDSGEILAMLLWGHQHNQQALEIVRQIPDVQRLPPNNQMEDSIAVHRLVTLARLCASQNEYGDAKKIIADAKEIAAREHTMGLSNKSLSMAMCYLEESRLSLGERDFGAAESLARKAAQILAQQIEIDQAQSNALRADVLEQLARSLASSPDKIGEAIDNQEKCLQLRQRSFGKDGLFGASTALDLARMLRQRLTLNCKNLHCDQSQADARRAHELLTNILAMCKRNQPSDTEVLRTDRNATLLLPQTYYELGCLSSACGNFPEAREYLQKACDLNMSFSEPAFIPYRVADLDALASLDLLQGKIEHARKLVLKASNLLDSYVADVLPQLSLAEQIAFTDNLERHINSLLAVCRDDASLIGPYTEMMKWKGFLTEQFRLRSSIIKNGDLGRLLESHQQLSRHLLSSYVQSAVSGTDNGAKVEESQIRKENIEREINARMRGQLKQSLAITPKDLQSSLGANEALVDLYEFAASPWDLKAHYGAVISTRDSLRWIDLGESSLINKFVNSWRSYDEIRTPLPKDEDPKIAAPADNAHSWEQLSKLLSVPLNKIIPPQTGNLWIADESDLARLPWGVLMSSYGGSRNYEVCQLDSPRELVNLKRQLAAKAVRKDMLIVGGIDYSKHVPPAPPLKNALTEVKEIQKRMESERVKCVIESDYLNTSRPTRNNIMAELAKCQLAHVVTHGFFNESDSESNSSDRSAKFSETRSAGDSFQMPARNPLIESGLLISTGRGSVRDSGFLTAEDLLDANLDGCRLITLSACETARGKEVNSQGVLGLRSALMGAGARSVLVSLWPVPDQATSELMNVFYQRLLQGDKPVVALAKAQEAVRSNPYMKAPYFWAAWILVGDGFSKISKS